MMTHLGNCFRPTLRTSGFTLLVMVAPKKEG
jgi:hypothetical protein